MLSFKKKKIDTHIQISTNILPKWNKSSPSYLIRTWWIPISQGVNHFVENKLLKIKFLSVRNHASSPFPPWFEGLSNLVPLNLKRGHNLRVGGESEKILVLSKSINMWLKFSCHIGLYILVTKLDFKLTLNIRFNKCHVSIHLKTNKYWLIYERIWIRYQPFSPHITLTGRWKKI